MAMSYANQGRISAYKSAAQKINPSNIGGALDSFSEVSKSLSELKSSFSSYYGEDASSLTSEIQKLVDQYNTINELMRKHFTVLSDAIDVYSKSTEANFADAYQRLRELDSALESFVEELRHVSSV